MDETKIIPPGQDYRALMEREARIDVATLLEAYDKEFGPAGNEAAEAKPKSKRVLAVVCGVLALSLLGGGWWAFGPEGAPLTRSTPGGVSDVVASAPAKDKPVIKEEPNPDAKKSPEVVEESKAPVEDKPSEKPPVVEKPVDPSIPVADAVKNRTQTEFGTHIVEFKDNTLPLYEQPACAVGSEECAEKGLSPADSYTGNNINDKFLAYRINFGFRRIGGLDEGFVSKELIVAAMTDNITRLKLDIPVPSSPDYASARVYSSGYSLWPISKGYTLIYGDSRGLGIIGPDKDGKSFDAVLKSSKEVLISQSYAGIRTVTFAPLSKTVAGAVIPDKEGEWQ